MEQLIKLIKNHGHKVIEATKNNTLLVASQNNFGIWSTDEIKADLKSVKRWLGY